MSISSSRKYAQRTDMNLGATKAKSGTEAANNSVLFRKPGPPPPVTTRNPPSKADSINKAPLRLRRPFVTGPSKGPPATGSASAGAIGRARLASSATSSPVSIRKATSSLGVHTAGVPNRNASSTTQRNVQPEGSQSFAGKGGVAASRSVDSLSNHVGSSNGAKTNSVCSSPLPPGEELRVLYQKITQLKEDLADRETVIAQLHQENQSLVKKSGSDVLPIEVDSPQTSIFYVSGSQPANHDSDIQSGYGTSERVVEQESLKQELQELRDKYKKLQTECKELQRTNNRLSSEYLRAESDYKHWKEAFYELKAYVDEEIERIKEDRKELKSQEKDMILVVRAANDYKTDAQEKLEAIEIENAALRAKLVALEETTRTSNETSRTRPPEAPLPLLTQSKSNTLDFSDIIEDVDHMEIAKITVPCKGNEENNTPLPVFRNNKEKCAGTEYNNQLNVDAKMHYDKRVITPALLSSTKRTDTSNGSTDDDDPLVSIAKATGTGSRRNALLRWCQSRTAGYPGVEITNFSTSWSNGLAFCALLHSYLPDRIPYDSLKSDNAEENLNTAFKAAESVAVQTTLNIDEMISQPVWQEVMNYIKEIYMKLECCD